MFERLLKMPLYLDDITVLPIERAFKELGGILRNDVSKSIRTDY